MKRKTLAFLCLAAAFAALAFPTIDDSRQALAQCGASSYGAYGDCSASSGYGFSYSPQMYSAPMRTAPIYNSAGMCLNCGRVHGAPAVAYGAPVYRDPLVNVQPPKVQFGLINLGYAPPRRARAPVVKTETKIVRRERVNWRSLKIKIDPYTGLMAVK